MLNWLTIIAILIGPIAAIQIQKWLEDYKEKKARKLQIFKTLMSTRGSRVSFEHVRALNMIDTEFSEEQNIRDAWKIYLDCLCEKETTDEISAKQWSQRKDDLFIDLLFCMAETLGYHFDKVHLQKAVYSPKAHSEEEEYLYIIRRYILDLIEEKKALPITLNESKISNKS